jgi:hypothetical protein
VDVSVDGGVTWNRATGKENWEYRYEMYPISKDPLLCPLNIKNNNTNTNMNKTNNTSINTNKKTLYLISRGVDDSGWVEGKYTPLKMNKKTVIIEII